MDDNTPPPPLPLDLDRTRGILFGKEFRGSLSDLRDLPYPLPSPSLLPARSCSRRRISISPCTESSIRGGKTCSGVFKSFPIPRPRLKSKLSSPHCDALKLRITATVEAIQGSEMIAGTRVGQFGRFGRKSRLNLKPWAAIKLPWPKWTIRRFKCILINPVIKPSRAATLGFHVFFSPPAWED